MTWKGFVITLLLLVLAGVTPMAVQSATRSGGDEPETAKPEQNQVERGRYLVHDVAQCIQCHSPRDAAGNLIEGQLLEGGAIPFDSPTANREWASLAPNIRGLNGYSDALGIRLLTDGVTRDGRSPLPPMPPFRLNEDDAAAVVAYLKSLV